MKFKFTLPCRERPGYFFYTRPQFYFNSRSRVGSDPFPIIRYVILVNFNSRSRVGSDFRLYYQFAYVIINFNSRSRVGSDKDINSFISFVKRFQFTLPCRERLAFAVAFFSGPVFQFTLPCRERHIFIIKIKI